MLTQIAYEDSQFSRRLSLWLHVRRFAVPATMIETANARRRVGDWAGACAAAGVDVDLDLRALARARGGELAGRIRADLRHLAPDLLRWHLPRVAPDGLLRPGLTIALARYDLAGHAAAPHDVARRDAVRAGGERAAPAVHLVVRTAPAGAAAGQRISLALWDGSPAADTAGPWPVRRPRRGPWPPRILPPLPPLPPYPHPHPHPSRRYRLDLHRHLWDARRAAELRNRAGAERPFDDGRSALLSCPDAESTSRDPLPEDLSAWELPCAVERWAAEARTVLRAEGRPAGAVTVRLGGRRRLVLDLAETAEAVGADAGADPVTARGTWPEAAAGTRAGVRARSLAVRFAADAAAHAVDALPVLPDAATWVLPDLELLRAGLIAPDRLHPLVAAALVPGRTAAGPPPATGRQAAEQAASGGRPRLVDCRGARHRIGVVDGVLAPLDHAPDELRRERLLATLTGTPLPCLRVIGEAHRRPDCLAEVRARLEHGDTAGALAVVEGLLGPAAVLPPGDLRDALEAAAQGRIAHGLFRAGLVGPGPRAPRRPLG